MERKNWFLILGVIGLTFFGIPLRISKNVSDDELLFNDYIVKFNKSYRFNETEYLVRMENFKASLKIIESLNKNRSSHSSAIYGLTVYSDLSQEEFKEMRLQTNRSTLNLQQRLSENSVFQKPDLQHFSSEKKKRNRQRNLNITRLKRTSDEIPLTVDWRKKGAVGPVHNQKTCGACWAFSAIETIESMNAIKNGTFLSLSVQEVIDCARNGNYGCEGGDSCALLKWLVTTKTKVITEKSYPFAYHTQTCKLKFPKDGVGVKNYNCDEFIDNESMLLEKLAYHGPVAASVNALNWQFYLGGIIQFHCTASPLDMNHAVQIVGYDRTGPVPHYIIRNSWGTEFGDNGYIYIAIGGNICGIANEVSSLDVE